MCLCAVVVSPKIYCKRSIRNIKVVYQYCLSLCARVRFGRARSERNNVCAARVGFGPNECARARAHLKGIKRNKQNHIRRTIKKRKMVKSDERCVCCEPKILHSHTDFYPFSIYKCAMLKHLHMPRSYKTANADHLILHSSRPRQITQNTHTHSPHVHPEQSGAWQRDDTNTQLP